MYKFMNMLQMGEHHRATLKTEAVHSRTVHRDYHPHYEVYFCPLGVSQDILINGKPYIIKQPSVIVSSPFSVHGMSKYNGEDDSFYRYTVYFDDEFIERECSGMLPGGMLGNYSSCIYLLTDEQRDIMRFIFDRVIDAAENTAEFAAYFIGAMQTLERTTPLESRISDGDKSFYYVVDVLRYIYENKHKPLSAELIAAEFHISRAKLDRDFRTFVGQTLHKTVTDFRIGHAIELLSTSSMRVRDIASACGFDDEYYFYAFFKKATGMTPLAMRRASARG